MHSVLLFVTNPEAEASAGSPAWRKFVGEVGRIAQQATGIEEIREGVWLIDIQTSIRALVDIVHLTQEKQLHYRVLFLPDPPKWICSSPIS